jgi:hypothetical protein
VVVARGRVHLHVRAALVLAANLFADAVRDGFDPRVRMGFVPA